MVAPDPSSVASGRRGDISMDFCPQKGPFWHQGCPAWLPGSRDWDLRKAGSESAPSHASTCCTANRDQAVRLPEHRHDDRPVPFIPGATPFLLYENNPRPRECLQPRQKRGRSSSLRRKATRTRRPSQPGAEQGTVINCEFSKKKRVSQPSH